MGPRLPGHPQFAQGYARLGWALDWGGDRQGALAAHRRAVELNPSLSDGLANVYHGGFGRLDEGARGLAPAVQADPANNVLHWMAGRTYVQLGMPDRARLHLEKAIEFEPAFPAPYETYFVALLLEGRRDEVRAQIERLLRATRRHQRRCSRRITRQRRWAISRQRGATSSRDCPRLRAG